MKYLPVNSPELTRTLLIFYLNITCSIFILPVPLLSRLVELVSA